jgi:hypothetical protein
MDYSSKILLTPHNYLEWKPKILLQLKYRDLYQITMEMEVEPDSSDEKKKNLNRQDMAIGCILWFISPKIFHQVYDDSQDSNPNKLWSTLEVLFGNKENCKKNVDKIEKLENPLEDQSSHFEEPSTQASAQICILLIADGVYSILDFFFQISCTSRITCRNFSMHHACISGATCMHHACILGDKKGATHIRFNYDIF